MANSENKPEIIPDLTPESEPIGIVRNGEDQVTVWRNEANDSLVIQVRRDNKPLFQALVTRENEVYTATRAQTSSAPPERKEFPDITMEGFTGREPVLHPSKTREGEKEYFVPLGYHPDPKDWSYTIWYNLYAFGNTAQALYDLGIGARKAVRIEGEDHTSMVRKQGGALKEERKIYVSAITPLPANTNPKPMLGETRRRSPAV